MVLLFESWAYLFAIGAYMYLFSETRNRLVLKIVFAVGTSFFFAWLFDPDGWALNPPVIFEKVKLVLPYVLNALTLLCLHELSKKNIKQFQTL
jgi:hypothetical protein